MVHVILSNTQLSRYENIIYTTRNVSPIFRSLVAGVAKIVRISKGSLNDHQRVIWDTVADVIGPALFFYIWWVLESAQKKKISRLYFLARDGHILFKIAQYISQQWRYDIQCHYLYTSREAWYFSAIERVGSFELQWMTNYFQSFRVSVETIFRRLGVTPDEVEICLVRYGFTRSIWNKDLSQKELQRMSLCLQDQEILHVLKKRIDRDFHNTLGYLTQEGLFAESRWGIVDIGWTGSLQYALNAIMAKAQKRSQEGMDGYYLGLNENQKLYQNDRVWAFLIHPGSRQYLRNDTLYCEVFAASPDARTIGYQYENGRYAPIFQKSTGALQIWGVELQHESIMKFTETMMSAFNANDFDLPTIYRLLERLLYSFLVAPSRQEADTYGQFPMAIDMQEERLAELAPKFEMKNYGLPKTYWVSASCVRSNIWVGKQLWKIIQQAPSFIKWLRWFFIKLNKLFRR